MRPFERHSFPVSPSGCEGVQRAEYSVERPTTPSTRRARRGHEVSARALGPRSLSWNGRRRSQVGANTHDMRSFRESGEGEARVRRFASYSRLAVAELKTSSVRGNQKCKKYAWNNVQV